jgi:hypothetical protein
LPIPIRIALLCVLAALTAPTASAAQCGDPKTTVGYFLDIVRTIALDYDLTDPKPIGTLLEGKLTPDAGRARPGYEDLAGSSMFGQPAQVTYSRHEDPQSNERGVVTLVIRPSASWPDVAPQRVEACLADIGEKARAIQVGDGPGLSWEKTIPRAVQDGGSIRVFWKTGRNAKRLEYLAIFLDR